MNTVHLTAIIIVLSISSITTLTYFNIVQLSGISCRTSIISFGFLLILLNEQFAFESDA